MLNSPKSIHTIHAYEWGREFNEILMLAYGRRDDTNIYVRAQNKYKNVIK